MNIMTIQTIAGCNRSMDIFFVVLAFMALVAEADLAVVCQKKSAFLDFRVLLIGWLMAGRALSVFNRLMGKRLVRLVWVASAIHRSGGLCRTFL